MSKHENLFIQGLIPIDFISNSIAKHQTKTTIGAHAIFMGQVRADTIEDKQVKSILYTAYQELAITKYKILRESAFSKFNLYCMHIHHSIGEVKVGEICFFAFVSSPNRKDIYKALEFMVTGVKNEIPIFGKEIFNDETTQWKINH